MNYDLCPNIACFFVVGKMVKLAVEINYQFLKIIVTFRHCYKENILAEKHSKYFQLKVAIFSLDYQQFISHNVSSYSWDQKSRKYDLVKALSVVICVEACMMLGKITHLLLKHDSSNVRKYWNKNIC